MCVSLINKSYCLNRKNLKSCRQPLTRCGTIFFDRPIANQNSMQNSIVIENSPSFRETPQLKLNPISCIDLTDNNNNNKKHEESCSEDDLDPENSKLLLNLHGNKDFQPKKASEFSKTSIRTRVHTVFERGQANFENTPTGEGDMAMFSSQKKPETGLFSILFKQKYKTWMQDFSPQISVDKSSQSDLTKINLNGSSPRKDSQEHMREVAAVHNEDGFIDFFSDINLSGHVSEHSNHRSPLLKLKPAYDFGHLNVNVCDSVKSSLSSSKIVGHTESVERGKTHSEGLLQRFATGEELATLGIRAPQKIGTNDLNNKTPKFLLEDSILLSDNNEKHSPFERSSLGVANLESKPLYSENPVEKTMSIPEITIPVRGEKPHINLKNTPYFHERTTQFLLAGRTPLINNEKSPNGNGLSPRDFSQIQENKQFLDEEFQRRKVKNRTVLIDNPPTILKTAAKMRRSIRCEKKDVIRRNDEAIKQCIELEEKLREIFELDFSKSSIRTLELAIKLLAELKCVIMNPMQIKQSYEYYEILEILDFVNKIINVGNKYLKYKGISSRNIIREKDANPKRQTFRYRKRMKTIKVKPSSSLSLEKRKSKQIEGRVSKQPTKQELPRESSQENKQKSSRRSESEKSIEIQDAAMETVKTQRKTRFSLKYGKEGPSLQILKSPEETGSSTKGGGMDFLWKENEKTKESMNISIENIVEKTEKLATPLNNPERKLKVQTSLGYQRTDEGFNIKMSSPGIFKRQCLKKPTIKTKLLECGQFFLEDQQEKDEDTKDIRHSPIFKYTKRKSVEVLSPARKGSPEGRRKKKPRMSVIGTLTGNSNSGTIPENSKFSRKKNRLLSYQLTRKNGEDIMRECMKTSAKGNLEGEGDKMKKIEEDAVKEIREELKNIAEKSENSIDNIRVSHSLFQCIYAFFLCIYTF